MNLSSLVITLNPNTDIASISEQISKYASIEVKEGDKIAVCISGGKDSTAMLLRMVEEGMRIDLIIFCDTGLEFPAMYRHLEKLERDIGMKVVHICADHTFEHFMLDHEVRVKINNSYEESDKKHRGYSWPGPVNRWCTKELKEIPRDKFFAPLREKYDIIEYVGLAADEGYRLERKNNMRENQRHPLVDWGMTEILLRPRLRLGRSLRIL